MSLEVNADPQPTVTEVVVQSADVVADTKQKRVTLIVGLGRFGTALARTLVDLGEDILCVDSNPKLVQHYSTLFPCVEVDMTDEIAVAGLGLDTFTTAVVAIGSDVEKNILCAGILLDNNVPSVWAKSITEQHARILERIGVQHVVRPEADAGARVGHLVSGRLVDYIEVDDDFVIAKMLAPVQIQGFTLSQSRVRTKYGITVLGTKSPNEPMIPATGETRILVGDLIIVGGAPQLIERFAKKR